MAAGVAAVAAFQLRKLVESLVVVGFIVFGILVKRLILPGDKLVTFHGGLSAPRGKERRVWKGREEDREISLCIALFLEFPKANEVHIRNYYNKFLAS